jgi:hypothetical protein
LKKAKKFGKKTKIDDYLFGKVKEYEHFHDFHGREPFDAWWAHEQDGWTCQQRKRGGRALVEYWRCKFMVCLC